LFFKKELHDATHNALFRSISHVQAKFDAKFQTTGQFQTTNTLVRVVGVGFFDFHYGQNGVLPNAVELGSVLDITFNQ
jgi:phage regulator Rha-like protein